MSAKRHSFNVLLTRQEYEQLDKLANKTRCAKSFIIRQALHWRFDMVVNGTPLCASGQRCFAPHLHQPPQPPQAPDPESAEGNPKG